MRRQQLWQALSDAAHAVMTATEDWKEDPTPAKRALVDGAVARYVDYLVLSSAQRPPFDLRPRREHSTTLWTDSRP
jgi:hypothetical protein